MNERTLADTALTIAPFVLFIAWVVTLITWGADMAPWLRTANILFFFIAAYGVSAIAQVRADRRLDEVELAAARFGARWGLVGGVAFVTLLTLLPPIHSLLAEIGSVFSRVEDESMSYESRLFLLAIMTTFIAQESLRSIFAAAWRWTKR